MPSGIRQPRLDRCRETADQREAFRPESDQPRSQHVDMSGGEPQQLDRNRVVRRCVCDDRRCDVPKSRGNALVNQRTIACGSD